MKLHADDFRLHHNLNHRNATTIPGTHLCERGNSSKWVGVTGQEDVDQISGVLSAETCSLACVEDFRCEYFTYDSNEATCWLKKNLRTKKFVPGYVSGVRCDAPVVGGLGAGTAMAAGIGGDDELANAAKAKQLSLKAALASYKAAGCIGKETIGSCVTIKASIIDAQKQYAAAYTAAFPSDVIGGKVVPSVLTFTTLDFDTVDHSVLERHLRTELGQLKIANFDAIPIAFTKGSIVATVNAETQADKNTIDEGAEQIIQGVLDVIRIGQQSNATRNAAAAGEVFEDAARADADSDSMPIWFYVVTTCGAALVFVLLGLAIARLSRNTDNEVVVTKANNLRFGVGVAQPEEWNVKVRAGLCILVLLCFHLIHLAVAGK